MSDSRTYKTVGSRFPNEGYNFPNNVRIQFINFYYTTSNPTEIATIENSDAYKNSKIIRVKAKAKSNLTPQTSGGVTSSSPMGKDRGDLIKKEQELEERMKKLEEKERELAEREEALTADPATTDETPQGAADPEGTEGKGEGPPAQDPPPPGGDESTGEQTGKQEETPPEDPPADDKKKGASKRK